MITRSDILAAIQKIRRELDTLERAVRETPAPSQPPASRTTPPTSRVNAPQRRAARRVTQRSASRTPATSKVPCEACRDYCWENCPCSCHQTRRAGATPPAR
jgi:hypothetical protein